MRFKYNGTNRWLLYVSDLNLSLGSKGSAGALGAAAAVARARHRWHAVGARSVKPAARSGSATRSRLDGALAVVVLWRALIKLAQRRKEQQQAGLEGERRRARRGGCGRTHEAQVAVGTRSAKPAARSGSATRSRLDGALAVVVLALIELAR